MNSTDNSLKISQYNCFATDRDGSLLGHNILRGTTFKCRQELYPIIFWLTDNTKSAAEINRLPANLKKMLYDKGFLVDESCDELALIKQRYNQTVFDGRTLHLVVLPSLWCNFQCPYCFENKKPVSMSENVQRQLVFWIQDTFPDKRSINVGWFGGEPLLEKDCIRQLTRSFVDLCDHIGARYSSSVTTNGFYLDKKFAAELDALKIRHVQITLDGHKNDHDRLRAQRNGSGSFDRIYQNIIDFHKSDTKAALTLRINCTDENFQGVPELISAFPDFVRERTQIYFRWVWANSASGNREFSAMRGEEPFSLLATLYDAASDAGWNISNPIRQDNPVYCEVDFRDHYTIAPSGDIFLCTHTFDTEERIGNILELEENQSVIGLRHLTGIARWLSTDCFSDLECLQCKVLPICKGGCRKERFEGHKACIAEKHSLTSYILNQARASGLV